MGNAHLDVLTRLHNAYEINIKDGRILAACESQNPSSTFSDIYGLLPTGFDTLNVYFICAYAMHVSRCPHEHA